MEDTGKILVGVDTIDHRPKYRTEYGAELRYQDNQPMEIGKTFQIQFRTLAMLTPRAMWDIMFPLSFPSLPVRS